ncbi:hypothetical protein OS493_009375 [Desmophyllum pertusum]|uniref:Uncharacterized protein n=1 Tax=Desmophyllum pertusum TaxID=174260 RepID=A0A9W9Z2Y1_9CNID|nr:hypothetical protein OS493_009375 [Desmophyllum pertusum]
MQRSKYNEADLGKEQPPRQQDSDGSGSVVSLQSSSSDDVKYPGIRGRDLHSEGAGVPAFQVEPVQKSNDDATRQNMGKLQQKLHTQPTHNTLDEIISTLKNQNGMNDSSIPGMSLPLHNDSTVGGKTYPSMQSYTSGGGWNSSPLQMSGHQKFGEKHTRQLKDITSHFEAEIDKICEQLNSVGNNLTALQDALPVRMLEAANHKLEARCNVLEQVCEQMKNKSARLEQTIQELDSNSGQLRQVNQNLEVRCLYLEQVTKANECEKSHLHENIRDLETKVLELAESNEKAVSAYHQLEELNQKVANRNQTMEESKSLLESRYKSCVGDNKN